MSKTLLQFVTFLPKQLYSHLFLPRMWHAVVLGVIALLLSLLLALKYLFVPNLENLQAQAEAELSSVLGAPAHIDGFHAEWGSQGILIRAERVGLNPAISGAKSNLELKNISASIQTLPLLWGSLRFAWLDVGELDAIVAYSAAQKWHIPGLAQANKTDRAGLKWLLAQENIRVQTIGLRILDPEQHFFANPEHSMTLNQFVIENRAWRHAVSLKHQHVAVAAQLSHAVLDAPEAYEKWQGQGFIQTDKLTQNIAVWLRAEDNETRLLAKTPQLDFVKLQSDLASVSSAFSPRVLAAFSDTLTPQAWLKMHEVQGLLRDTQLEAVFPAISELRNKQAFTPKLVNLSTGFDALSATGLAPAPIVQWSGAVQLVAHSTEKILAQRENNERRWSVDVTKLDWRSPDFAGQASLQANDIGGEHPLMTAQLVVQDLPIKTALAWLPKSSLSEWMNKALQADTLQGGVFKKLSISLKDSRKDNLKESLKIQAEVNQASFDFSPTSSPGLWPALVNLDAKLEYKNQQISWSEAKANTLGVGLTAASGRYDLEKLILQMEAKASASPPQLLAYMNIVPVEKIKGFAQTIQDQIRMSNTLGVLSSQFSFKADLNEKKASPLKFNAEMQWLAPSVSLSNFNGLALEKLDLKAAVSERGLNIESLNALAFGQPLSVTGKLDEQGMGQFRLTGRTEIKRIAEAVPYTALALLKTALVGADGVMGFDAQINQNTQGQNLLISSDLRDVSFNIPSILQKTKGNVLPLQFNAQLNNVQSSKTNSLGIKKFSANANLGAQIQAQFEGIVDSKTGLQVQRGGLAIGQNSVLNVPDAGIATHISLPSIDADTLIERYSAVISEGLGVGDVNVNNANISNVNQSAFNQKNTADFLPSSIAFESADVKLSGRHFLNVYAGANRTQNVWAVSLGADQIRGYLSWQAPDAQQKRGMVTGIFDELSIPESEIKSLTTQISKIQTQSLPAVQLSVKQFNLGGKSLGSLELKAVNAPDVAGQTLWDIQNLSLDMPDLSLKSQGRWQGGTKSRTSMDLVIQTANAEKALLRFGLGGVIKNTEAKVSGQLHWAGAPHEFDYKTLDGVVDVKAGKGQFLKVQPGAARLLGLFSLQSIPRRLTLDFRDLFSDGFAYDSIEAKAEVKAGLVQLGQFVMKGPAAEVVGAGNINLANETQNLQFTVKPDFNLGGVSLAYVALNPPVGLTTLLLQFLLRDPIRSALAIDYDVTGAWQDPQVKQTNRKIAISNTAPPSVSLERKP